MAKETRSCMKVMTPTIRISLQELDSHMVGIDVSPAWRYENGFTMR